MARPLSEKPLAIATPMGLNLRESRVWRIIAMQLAVLVVFISYTALLFSLPTLWDGRKSDPTSQTKPPSARESPAADEDPGESLLTDGSPSSTAALAVDVWFALILSASCDAVSTVATFNRSVIDHWHYFISVRMMAFGAISSALVATPYAWQHPVLK